MSLSLGTATIVAFCLSAAPAAAAEAPAPAQRTEAQASFEEGLSAYERGDYDRAVDWWTESYDAMSDESLSDARHVLAFDIARAQVRAYEVDRDDARLLEARRLLEAYLAWIDRPEHTKSLAEQEDRIRALEMLEQIEEELRPPAPAVPAPVVVPDTTPPPVVDRPPQRHDRKRLGSGLIIGGSVSLGVSAAFAGLAGAMVVKGRDAEDRFEAESGSPNPDDDELRRADEDGQRANAGFIAGTAVSAITGVAGIAMIVSGAVIRRRSIGATAVLSPNMAGAQLRVRF